MPSPPRSGDVWTCQNQHADHHARDEPHGSLPFEPGGAEERHHQESHEKGDRQEQPLRAGQVSRDAEPDRREQPGKPAVAKKANRGPESKRPGKQKGALRKHVHDDVAGKRIDDRQQASEPRRSFAEELERQHVNRDHKQNGAGERQPERGPLPRDRSHVAQEPMHRSERERMKRMVRAPQGDIMPRAGLDLLGLMDVAQAVGEAGLRMMNVPRKQRRRHRHEQHDGSSVLEVPAPG